MIFNTSTGQLYYDADGSGAGTSVLIATVQGAPALAATDIRILAPIPGKQAVGNDLRYQATIGKTARECTIQAGQITARIGIQGRVIAGPAGAPTSVQIPLRVAVVQAGVITKTLQDEVEKQGLFYPPDPASRVDCTLGGNIATNAGGPRCLKYGVTRDYVLGLEVVLADGRVLRTGRRTVKGVAGYDLAKLIDELKRP